MLVKMKKMASNKWEKGKKRGLRVPNEFKSANMAAKHCGPYSFTFLEKGQKRGKTMFYKIFIDDHLRK